MQSYWFGDVDDERCSPFDGDVNACVDRIRSISASMDTFIPLDWKQSVLCGTCRDRADYLGRLQAVCIAAAERSIREQYSGKDAELLQMVRTLDEIDTVSTCCLNAWQTGIWSGTQCSPVSTAGPRHTFL
jgi:hypothetical protein